MTLGEFGFYQSSNLFRLFFSHAHFARAAMAGVRPPRKRSLPRVTRQLLGDDIRKQLRNRWVRIPTRARSGPENTRSSSVVPAHECAEFKER